MRLGLREIKGLSEDDAKLIVGRRGVAYNSVRDVWLRTGLSPRVLERLADADAFASLGLTRREALWAAKALGRVGDRDDDLPLFAADGGAAPPSLVAREPDVALPPMPLGEEVVNDYRFLRLSLRAHPAQFLRADLEARGILRNEALRSTPNNARVTISGLVTCRQRPGSAKGVVFMTIEDESAVANVIVWPKVFERVRPGRAGRALRGGHRPRAVGAGRHPRGRRISSRISPCCWRDWPSKATTSTASRAPTKCAARSRISVRHMRSAAATAAHAPDARNAGAGRRPRCHRARLGARADTKRRIDSYSGTTSPRPTLTRLVSSEPSGFFSARMMATCAPGFSSPLSPTA